MAVKYPEFNELKKESAFDWSVKSEGESFTKNKAIIRFDMFTQNRKVSISNDMKKAILTLLKKYVDAEQTSYADVTIMIEFTVKQNIVIVIIRFSDGHNVTTSTAFSF